MNLSTPLLVILPGFDGSVELYTPFCQHVEREGGEAVVIGYPTNLPLTADELLEYVESRIPIDRRIILMGVSFGGPIAARLLARKRREYIGGVFCTTFIRSPRPFVLKFRRIFPVKSLSFFFRSAFLVRYFFYQRDSDKGLIQQFQQVNSGLHPSVLSCRIEMLAHLDKQGIEEQLNIPSCYLQASGDKIVPEHSAKELKSILRSLQVITVHGPHALLQCRPRESWRHIRSFINQL